VKEIFAAFGSEVFRPLVTLLLPSAVAISVWCVCIIQRFPPLYRFADANHVEFAFAVVLITLFVGLLLEDLGSRIESTLLDPKLDAKTDHEHERVWWLYLRTAYKVEPIGQRYLRTIVLRMKFELSTCLALILFTIGLFFVNMPVGYALMTCAFTVALSIWLFFEARESHELLDSIRRELLRGVTIVG
jgi:hypothetical protein